MGATNRRENHRAPALALHDLAAARIDRTLRALVAAESGGADPGPLPHCRAILANLEAEAVAFGARVGRIARACRRPLDADAIELLRGAAAVFLPGESADPSDRATRDRIEAATDAAAELADAIECAAVAR